MCRARISWSVCQRPILQALDWKWNVQWIQKTFKLFFIISCDRFLPIFGVVVVLWISLTGMTCSKQTLKEDVVMVEWPELAYSFQLQSQLVITWNIFPLLVLKNTLCSVVALQKLNNLVVINKKVVTIKVPYYNSLLFSQGITEAWNKDVSARISWRRMSVRVGVPLPSWQCWLFWPVRGVSYKRPKVVQGCFECHGAEPPRR